MELRTNTAVRKGGVVWLFTAIIVALVWQSPLELWPTFLMSWAIVGIAWVAVKRIKRTLSRDDTIGAVLAFAIVVMIAWLCGIVFMKFNSMVFDSVVWESGIIDDRYALDEQSKSYLNYITLSLMMAVVAVAWLISVVLPSAAKQNGSNPLSLLASSAKQLKSSGAVGQMLLLTGGIIVAAVMISYTSDGLVKIAMGLVVAYTQIRFMAYVDRSKADLSGASVADQASKGIRPKRRRGVLIALFSLHLVFSLFYIVLLSFMNEANWMVVFLYPLSWLIGACIALLAWLFAQVKVLYVLLLVLITLACAILLGMIAGLYGMETIA